jgi:hypothetical protein
MKDHVFYNLDSRIWKKLAEYKQEMANIIRRGRNIVLNASPRTLSKLTTNIATGTGLSISFAE